MNNQTNSATRLQGLATDIPADIPTVAITARQLGIVSQLYLTRLDILLKEQQTSYSQFSILNHLSHSTKLQHTISEITEAMEMKQPGVTKIVSKLADEQLIEVTTDKDDSQKRLVSITDKGYQKIQSINLALYPDIKKCFEDWEEDELTSFTQALTKLGQWLDKNRL